MKKHGESVARTPEYISWKSLRARAGKKKGYMNINVCPRWGSFENFLADMGRKPFPGHSIDRIDNNLGYCPENCRWASPEEQQNNRSSNFIIEIDGVSKSLTEWARHNGVSPDAAMKRIANGWPVELAVSVRTLSKSMAAKISRARQLGASIIELLPEPPK